MTKRNVFIVSVSVLLITVVVLIVLGRIGDFRSCAERGQNLTESLQSGEYEKARKDLDPILAATLTKDHLAQLWSKVIAQAGQLKDYTVTHTGPVTDQGGNQFVCLTCDFEKCRKWMVLVFDESRQITTLALCDTPNEYQSVINQIRQQAR